MLHLRVRGSSQGCRLDSAHGMRPYRSPTLLEGIPGLYSQKQPGQYTVMLQAQYVISLSVAFSVHFLSVAHIMSSLCQSALSLSYKVSISLLSLSLCLHGQGRQPVCNRPKFDGAEWDYEEQDHVGGKCMTPFTDGDIRELVDGLYLSQPCSLGLILSLNLCHNSLPYSFPATISFWFSYALMPHSR